MNVLRATKSGSCQQNAYARVVGGNVPFMRLQNLLILLTLATVAVNCKRQQPESVLPRDKPCPDSERFGLQSISSEADSLEIRIWYSYSYLDRVPVVSIRQSKTGEWVGYLYLIIWSFNEAPPKVQETRVRKLEPQTVWPILYAKLEKLHILSLPEMDSQDGGLDGSSYRFEVEKDGDCWSYSYWMPQDLQSRNPNARNVVQILETIESELGVPWGMDNDEQRKAFWTMALDSTLKLHH